MKAADKVVELKEDRSLSNPVEALKLFSGLNLQLPKLRLQLRWSNLHYRSLFARLVMVCKSRPEVGIKEAVGHYEFSVVPRSLFAPDGTMLQCSCKSAIMHILEKFKGDSNSGVTSETSTKNTDVQVKVAIVDAMADVQSLDKPDWIKTCKDLAEHFSNRHSANMMTPRKFA